MMDNVGYIIIAIWAALTVAGYFSFQEMYKNFNPEEFSKKTVVFSILAIVLPLVSMVVWWVLTLHLFSEISFWVFPFVMANLLIHLLVTGRTKYQRNLFRFTQFLLVAKDFALSLVYTCALIYTQKLWVPVCLFLVLAISHVTLRSLWRTFNLDFVNNKWFFVTIPNFFDRTDVMMCSNENLDGSINRSWRIEQDKSYEQIYYFFLGENRRTTQWYLLGHGNDLMGLYQARMTQSLFSRITTPSLEFQTYYTVGVKSSEKNKYLALGNEIKFYNF